VSLWSCPEHGLSGPIGCCGKASLANLTAPFQSSVASVMFDDGLIAKLQAENASLRSELERCRAANVYDAEAHRLAGTLGDENAKLREVLLEYVVEYSHIADSYTDRMALEDRARALLGRNERLQ
jgi:hypothetical protein